MPTIKRTPTHFIDVKIKLCFTVILSRMGHRMIFRLCLGIREIFGRPAKAKNKRSNARKYLVGQ